MSHSNKEKSIDLIFSFLLRSIIFKYACVLLVLALASFWVYCTNKYAVNIFYWDQWDFYNPFTTDIHLLKTFTKQHGPHRQGIGFILTKCIDCFSGMNVRYISFAITFLMFTTSVCYFYLKKQLFGKVTAFDCIIFLIILIPTQLFMHTPNISHGAMPSLLLSLYCLSFLFKNYALRSACLILINFNMIFSGFGLFIGALTPIIFLGEWYFLYRSKLVKAQFVAICSLLLSIFSFYLFSIGYTFQPAVANFVFPHPNPLKYIEFMILGYANFWGVVKIGVMSYTLGIITLITLLIVLFKHGVKIFKFTFDVNNREVLISKIIVILIAYSLIFLFNTAIGRVCVGVETARSARYMPYLAPSILALFLHFNIKLSKRLILLLFLGLLIGLGLGKKNTQTMANIASAKRAWKKSYLNYENIEKADTQSNFLIYPDPVATKLKTKLEYLKKNQLNLYSE